MIFRLAFEEEEKRSRDLSPRSQNLEQQRRELLTKSELQRAEEYKNLLRNDTEARRKKEERMQEELERERSLDRGVLNEYIKKDLDLFYVSKIIRGLIKNINQYDEVEVLKEDYSKLVAYVVRKVEK